MSPFASPTKRLSFTVPHSVLDSSTNSSLLLTSNPQMHLPFENSESSEPIHPHHHVSHAVALTAEIADPATAHQIIEKEEKWATSADDNTSDTPLSGNDAQQPETPKNQVTVQEEEKMERVQSKADLAAMMANFPDGGTRAWLQLLGATLIAVSTFGRFPAGDGW